MMRNRPRGGMAGGGHVGAGLLGEGPGMSTGMKRMMSGSGGGEGGLLGKGPNQGRIPNQPNQGRMPQQPNQGRMPQQPNQGRSSQQPNQGRLNQRPNQGRMQQPPRPPRSLLGTPGVEEPHMRHGSILEHPQERQAFGGSGHMAEMEYYEEPEHTGGYIEEEEHYSHGFEDQGNVYDHQQDHFAGHEQDLDYGIAPPTNSGRMAQGRVPLAGRAPNDRQESISRWDPLRSQPDVVNRQNQRELMQKATNQVRMQQQSPRSLLDAPFGGRREPHDQQHGRREMQTFGEGGHMEEMEFYEEPKQVGGYMDEDPYAQGYEPPRNVMDSGRDQMNAHNERRSRFEPQRPQQNPMSQQKTKQRELMEKADLQMKLLEEEKRMEQEQRERMMMMQQQQALILQQQQQQQQMQMQQQKMQLMQQQAKILGINPAQGNMGPIPSIFDLPTGGKTALGKRPGAMSRESDNKKLRKGPGDRWERNRSLSGNRDKKPLASSNRRDLQRNRRDRAGNMRSRVAARGNNRRDRKNSGSGRARNQGRDKDRAPRSSSNRDRGRSSRSGRSKEGSEDKTKDKTKGDAASSKDKKSEEYDPAEPTGEVLPEKAGEEISVDVKVTDESTETKEKEGEKMEEEGTTEEKKDAEISLTVTVNKKGRSVNDSDKKDDSNQDSPSKTKKYKCNVCIVDCYDEESFARHMKGKKHREKMDLVMSSTSHQEVLIKSRLQAEEHLRQIEEAQKSPTTKPAPKGKALETHCKVCDKKFTGAYKDHKDSTDHKAKEDRSKAGCKICNVTTFNTYHDYRKHLQSDWHKKNEKQESWPKCKLCNQKFKSPRKFVQHCKTQRHIQNRKKLQKDDEEEELSELVTLDTVGFEDDSTSEQNKNTQDRENTNSPEFRKPLPVTSTSTPKATRSTSEDEDAIPDEYDPTVAVGKKYIVPVAGFFCKVCHKFYNNETAARVTHCQSKSHYDRVLKQIDAKKQKALAEQGTPRVSGDTSETPSDAGKPTDKVTNAENTSQSTNGNDSINDNDESMETSQVTITDEQTDTTIEDEESSVYESVSESEIPIVKIDITEKPAAKSPTKGRQQRARRGGAGRGRGAKKH